MKQPSPIECGPASPRCRPSLLKALLVLAAAMAPQLSLADPTYRNDPQVRQALEALKTEDPAQIRQRWGDLAEAVAGRQWAGGVPSQQASLWREATWLVPGAVMAYTTGYCGLNRECQKFDWMIQFDAAKNQLTYITTNDLEWMTGQVQADGSVKVKKWFVIFETVHFDRQAQHFVVSDFASTTLPVPLRKATAADLFRYSKGMAGDATLAKAEEQAAEAAAAEQRKQQEATREAAERERLAAESKRIASERQRLAALATERERRAVAAQQVSSPGQGKPTRAAWAPDYGPFEAAAGRHYLGDNTAAVVDRTPDGALLITTRYLRSSSTPFVLAFRPTPTPGVFERFDPSTNAPVPGALATLQSGTLVFEMENEPWEGGKVKYVANWSATTNHLVLKAQRFRTTADGTAILPAIYSGGSTYALSSKEAVDAHYARELAVEAQDAAEAEAARRRDDSDRLAGRVGGHVPQRSFGDVFAGTFRQEMQAKQAQDARQQAFLAGVARDVRAIEQARGRATGGGAPVAVPSVPPAARDEGTTRSTVSVAKAVPPSPATDRTASSRQSAGPGAGGPLTFIVYQAMTPGPKAKSNAFCHSNVITVPGPDGFQNGKGPGGSEAGAVDKAISMIKSYFELFRQKCNQSADGQRQLGVYGTTQYDFNTLSEPDRVQRVLSRFRSGADMLQVDLAPR